LVHELVQGDEQELHEGFVNFGWHWQELHAPVGKLDSPLGLIGKVEILVL
jgi:hypothetical protein